MAFDITLAILFVGFSAVLAYLAATTETDNEFVFNIVINNAMRLIFFAGSLGLMIIGLNYGTLISEDACAASGITSVPQTAYGISVWIFVFVVFCILLSIIYSIFIGMKIKKEEENKR